VTAKRVVILGGDFGGDFTAKYLRKTVDPSVVIELINDTNYFVFQPLLPEVAAGIISASDAVTPLRVMLRGVNVRMAHAFDANEEDALAKAMQVFWQKGFESASIADLIEGTGVNRGSLYNAFGGKHPLFVKALLKYDRDNRRNKLAQLEALDNPKQAINKLFDGIVAETVADTEKKGKRVVIFERK